MPVEQPDPSRTPDGDAAAILARGDAADRHGDTRLRAAIDDYLIAEHNRPDDRARAQLAAVIARDVAAIARDLAASGAAKPVTARLQAAGTFAHRPLMAAWLSTVRGEILSQALIAARPPGATGGLIARLTDCEEPEVAAAAAAHGAAAREGPMALPMLAYVFLTYRVAAALREQGADTARLAERAAAMVTAHIRHGGADRAPMQLVAAIDARPAELPELIAEALIEGQVSLAAAVIAHARKIDHDEALTALLDPEGDRLWLLLRAEGIGRTAIARIALLLAEADPRRDIERFADELDTIADIPATEARSAVAPLGLDRDFREAIRALNRTRAR